MHTSKKIIVNHSTGTAFLHLSSIVRIEAISNYSKLYFTDGKTLVVAKVLKWFDDKLSPAGFIRIHRSHLINGAAILLIAQNSLQLETKEWLTISKRKKTSCLHLLKKRIAA